MNDDPWADDPYSDDGFDPSDSAEDTGAQYGTFDSEENDVAPSNNVNIQTDGKITGTFKQHGGYDAAWLVVRGETATEYLNTLAEIEAQNVLGRTAELAGKFAATKPAPQAPPQQYQQQAPQGSGYQQPQAAPQGGGGQLPPGVQQKFCDHGAMVFRSGTNKWDKPYQAFFCNTPKNTPGQCKAVFL